MKLEDEIKSTFRNEYHKAIVNLYYTNALVGEQFYELLKKHGLAVPQFNVLRILKGATQATSIGSIKERMLDKNSDVSRIVDRLYKKGLVKRKESANDRRLKDVQITRDGLKLLDELSIFEQYENEILCNLNTEEVELLNHLLDKIRDPRNTEK